MIQERDDIVALDSAIIQHPRAWEASGHLAGFTDPLVDCRACKKRFRADHLQEVRDGVAEHPDIRCGHAPSKLPGDHPDFKLTEAREFNLMGETSSARRRTQAPPSTSGPRPRRASSSPSRPPSSTRVRSRRSGSRRWASRSATRSHRRTSSSARSSSSRWRWSSSCRPPRPSGGSTAGWSSAWSGTSRSGSSARACGCGPMTRTSSRTTRARRATSSTSTRSAGRSSRASRTGAELDLTQHAEYSGTKLEYVDAYRERRALCAACDRAGRRRGPDGTGAAATPTTRTTSAASSAPSCALPPTSPRSRWRCCRS